MGSKLPEDKRHYSVDEMMDRLKDVQAVKDGRGRKRRRSKQAQAEPNQLFQRNLVKITIGLAVVVLVVAVVIFAVSKFNEFRYGGAKFSESVAERLSELAGMKVALGKFEVDGRSIGMREGLVSGDAGDFLRSGRLRGFKGQLEYRSFFGDEWYFDRFEIFEASAVVDLAASGVQDGGALPVGRGEVGGGGLGLSKRPAAIVPEVIRLRDCDLYWAEEGSGLSIEEADVVAEVFSGEMSVHANGGALQVPGFPKWNLQNVTATWSEGVLKIDQSRFSVEDRDEMRLLGTIDTKPGGAVNLKGNVTDLALSRLLPEYWSGKMEGILESEFAVDLKGEGALEFGGSFEIRDFILRGLPVFDALAIYAGEHGLGFMELPKVKGQFKREGGVMKISEFESLKSGLLRIRGELTVADGNLGGVIEIGLPDALFDKLGGGRPDLFRVEADGFAWAPMRLSGTLDSPVEDLSAKLTELTRARSGGRISPAEGGGAADGSGAAATKGSDATGEPAVGSDGDGGQNPGDGSVPSNASEREKKIEDAFENLINSQ